MTNLIPFDFENQMIRAVLRDEEPWFVANDVCQVLDIKNPRDAVERLDDDERGVANTDTLGGAQSMNIISESGLYALTFTSRKPEAKRFRKWVTATLLPTLRRTGRFTLAQGANQAETLLDMEPARMTAIVAVVRMAGRLYGAAAARRTWMECGLPDLAGSAPGASSDPLAATLALWLEDHTCCTIPEAAAALGLPLGFAQRRRVGDLLRALGWLSRVERRGEAVVRVFRHAA